MKNIKKIIALFAALALATGFSGCGANKGENTVGKVVKIGASVTPHAEILNVAKEILKEEGIDLQIKEFNDYVQPNTAVENGDLDANYFQHVQYLGDFNEENKTHLVNVAEIHYEPFGLYPGKTKTIDDLQDGAAIAIPNDGTNEARALLLLQAQGLIKLKDGTGFTATKIDIAENKLNLDIQEIDAAQLARSLDDVDMAVINGNYAIQAGLNVNDDAVAVEDKESEAAKTYANVLVVKEGNETNENIKALEKALKSDKVKEFIEEKYDGSVIPLF